MSFKVTVKTVGNIKFQIEANDFTTVADLEEAIRSDAPAEFLKGATIKKLLFKGKSLKPETTVGSLNLGPKDEIVCLAKRKRGRKSKTESPVKPEEKENDAKPAADRKYEIKEEDLKKLMGMGFPHHQVVVSLKAAFGDPTLACQYLIAGGIPADRAMALHRESMEAQKENGGAAQPMQPMQAPAAPVGPQGMPAQLEALLSNKDALGEVLGNSQVQQQCIGMLSQENPELFKRFMADPDRVGETEEFAKAMFVILQKSFQPRKPKVINLTEEDRANLKTLQDECHLSRQQAAQAYFKFGKDVEKAKAFCLDLLAKAKAEAESRNRAQSPAPIPSVRRPFSPTGSNANRHAFPTKDDAKKDEEKPTAIRMREPEPELEESKEAECETELTITPDMLFGDDEEE